jgi:CheY-like chemotaxis protein
MERLLRLKGFDAVAVATAVGAAKRLRDERFDVLLADPRLTPDHGRELVRLAEAKGTPSLAFTPLDEQADIDRSLASGFLHHLTLPVPLAEMVRIIKEIVGLNDPS